MVRESKRLQQEVRLMLEHDGDVVAALEQLKVPREAKPNVVTVTGIVLQPGGILEATVVYRKHYPMNVKWLAYSPVGFLFGSTATLSKDCQSFPIYHHSYYSKGYIGLTVTSLSDNPMGEMVWQLNPYNPQKFEETFVALNMGGIAEVEGRLGEEGTAILHRLAIAWENPSFELLPVFMSEIERNYQMGELQLVLKLREKGYLLGGEFAEGQMQ